MPDFYTVKIANIMQAIKIQPEYRQGQLFRTIFWTTRFYENKLNRAI